MPSPVASLVQQIASRFRYPQLFVVVLILFLLDLVIPDMIPFADEILLGLLTVILGSLRPERGGAEGDGEGERPMKNVTPRD
jgi:hypothetical protein